MYCTYVLSSFNLSVESSQELLVVASLYTNLGVILSKMGLLNEVSNRFVYFPIHVAEFHNFNRLEHLYREH